MALPRAGSTRSSTNRWAFRYRSLAAVATRGSSRSLNTRTQMFTSPESASASVRRSAVSASRSLNTTALDSSTTASVTPSKTVSSMRKDDISRLRART